ncbi:Leucine Rich repeats (2 copies) [Polystyrenella longa]|uniref:Leucine Rich repeats (2 copies) n=1 Tax=Polystyrenella longa TaxID=2528007 RepID=A0A518CH36_9PLAN|nr:hypothetical protein [Polystyrenella longa]QDU78484.1 Leucine Rich repeats (2 copies) [Polystyrenella longa]
MLTSEPDSAAQPDTPPAKTSPRYRYLKYSLLVLLLIVVFLFWKWDDLLLAMTPGLDAEAQQKIVAELEPLGIKSEQDAETGEIVKVFFPPQRTFTDDILLKLAGFDSLKELQIEDGPFTNQGLKVVRTMPNLERVFAGGTAITDSGLADLTRCPKLRILNLDRCTEISKEGWTQLKHFPNLQSLSVHDCEFGEEGAEAIAKHGALLEVRLSGAQHINKQAMSHIASIPGLQVFTLYSSRMKDESFVELAAATQLRMLEIDYCSNLTDKSMEAIGQLKKLQLLNMMGCQKISDDGLAMISGLEDMESLNIYLTGTTSSGLKHLQNMHQIKRIRFNALNATDEDIEPLANFLHLEGLYLPGADISDEALKPLQSLKELNTISLGGNQQFTGEGLKYLTGSKGVDKVVLANIPVGNDAILILQEFPELKQLVLRDVLVDDQAIPQLAKLESLEQIQLIFTGITRDEAKRLDELLPNCNVAFFQKQNP